MTTIYKLENILGIESTEVDSKIMSGAEARSQGISIRGKGIASIEDLYTDFNAGNGMFSGKVKVVEGVFEFDFDNNRYQKIN